MPNKIPEDPFKSYFMKNNELHMPTSSSFGHQFKFLIASLLGDTEWKIQLVYRSALSTALKAAPENRAEIKANLYIALRNKLGTNKEFENAISSVAIQKLRIKSNDLSPEQKRAAILLAPNLGSSSILTNAIKAVGHIKLTDTKEQILEKIIGKSAKIDTYLELPDEKLELVLYELLQISPETQALFEQKTEPQKTNILKALGTNSTTLESEINFEEERIELFDLIKDPSQRVSLEKLLNKNKNDTKTSLNLIRNLKVVLSAKIPIELALKWLKDKEQGLKIGLQDVPHSLEIKQAKDPSIEIANNIRTIQTAIVNGKSLSEASAEAVELFLKEVIEKATDSQKNQALLAIGPDINAAFTLPISLFNLINETSFDQKIEEMRYSYTIRYESENVQITVDSTKESPYQCHMQMIIKPDGTNSITEFNIESKAPMD